MNKTDEDLWMQISGLSKSDFERVSQAFLSESKIEENQKKDIIRFGLRTFANLEITKKDKAAQYRALLTGLAAIFLNAKSSN